MTRTIFLLLLILAAERPPAQPADTAGRLTGRALAETPLLDDLRELTDTIGGRPTGSPACERAVAWAAARFKAAGLQTVSRERFTVPALWLPGTAEAASLSPEAFPIRVVASPYSASTPGGGFLEAQLVDAGDGSPEEFERLGPSASGAIALVSSTEMKSLDDLFVEYIRTAPMLEAASKARVAALLLMSTRPRGLLYRHPVSVNGTIVPMPVGLASREQTARLRRLMERGPVRVRLKLANVTGGAYESENVIAEICGRERPEEIVLIGAHLDSWDLGTGAEDNGVNVALVLDVARGFTQLALAPRRTVRFALYTGEEQGLWGSAGYVTSHAREMDKHAAVLVLDMGSGRITGFYLNGREDLRAPLARALEPLAGLGPFQILKEALDGSDNFDFLLAGVPNLFAAQDVSNYLPEYHAESDVFDRVNTREAKSNVAIASALIWALAESPDRPIPRQTRAEVEELLVKTGIDSQMKAFGQWNDWTAGQRGAHSR
ncbi:MAG TPA: M28 family peptidase [Candidatus Polarisedimenticolia bacterium]|nr:M28 family peptidase [Candidatus Polarisedimenticolia bacterium]